MGCVDVADFEVEYDGDVAALDATLQQIGAVVLGMGEGGPVYSNGYLVVRAVGNPGFVKFAMENQGYVKRVVRQLDELL